MIGLRLRDESDTRRLGEALARLTRPGWVVGLVGPLGAGKTRLVRAWAEALQVDPRAISSPTFVLIQEYEGILPVYHFDAYRLSGPSEFEALGAPDYFERADGVCLIEWADRVAGVLPSDTWWITITPEPDASAARTVAIDRHGASGAGALQSLRAALAGFDGEASRT
jgi:tRNA threonylcarbamoyladenosine biosynthesis protein TsaE